MKFFRKALLMAFSILTLCALALFAAACGGNEDDGGNDDPKTVGYTVEVYLAEGDDFVLSAQHGSTGTGEVGKSLTLPAPQISGYVFDSANAGNVTTLTLSETAAENVFRFYYSAETKGALVYNANAPRGTSARGSMQSTAADEDGRVTVSENGFSISGYRFAGWSYTANGKAEVQPGDTLTATSPVTLYAVWDRGYTDRFGGTDLVYLPSAESGKVLLVRGGVELGTADLTDGCFSFTLPDKSKLEGKVFTDGSYTFAYADEALAGSYTFHTSYYNFGSADGSTAPDPATTLTIDKFGSGVYTHEITSGGRTETVTEKGYIAAYSFGDAPEYLFVITEGVNEGGGFIFRLGTYGEDEAVYTTTNGEAGLYTLAISPDGNIFYTQGFSLQLDGYGDLVLQFADYTGEWEGEYWIDGMYSLNTEYSIYKLHLRIQDDIHGNLETLGYDVNDGIVELSVYTMPLSEDSFVYVEPNQEEGEYRSADGATLKLDGFKNFADSATYTLNGVEHYGSYETIWAQTGSKLTVIMHENDLDGIYLGYDYTFGIDLALQASGAFEILNTFSVITETQSGTAYRLLDRNGFGDKLLTVSTEPYEGVTGAVKATLGTVNNLGGYTKLADGYVTQSSLGYAALYSFTRTALGESANAADAPKSMIFEVSGTYDSNFFLYDIYFVYSAVYEGDGGDREVKNYIELTDEEGSGAKIWYMTLPAQGLNAGSLYFGADGTVQAGSFAIDAVDASTYFGHVGVFTILNGTTGAVNFLYFDLQYDASGNPSHFTDLVELEYPVFTVDASGNIDNMVHLILRGGEGLYSKSGDFEGGNTVRGSIVHAGTTVFGEDILVLRSGNEDVLRFVTDSMLFQQPGYPSDQISVYHLYDPAFDKTFTASDGSTLTLDGFRSGSYTAGGSTVTGSYTLSADGKIVYLSAGSRRYTFDVSGELTLTDGIYGTYAMYSGSDWWDITFDGHGNATAKLGPKSESGVYVLQDDGSVLLFINIVKDVNSYRLQLSSIEDHGEAFVYDENLAGAFIGEDWTILYLDGYRSGTYYFPDGFGRTTVYYSVLDEEIGYVNIRTEGYVQQNVVLNVEKKTMSYPKYVDREYIYYGEDLSALIISENGDIEMNNTSGYYILADGVNRAYLLNSGTGDYYSVDLGSKPTAGTWTVGGVTYYEWQSGQKVTLTGTVEVDYESTKTTGEATLSFPLTGESVMTMEGTLVYDGETYPVDLISTYYDAFAGTRRGLAVVDWSRYDYSPITEYAYDGNGGGTFKVTITATTSELKDIFEEQEGITSTLTEYRVGFGPIEVTSRKLSGNIFVGDGKYLEFTDEDIEATFYYSSDEGRRYNVIFTSDGVTYSLQYSKGDAENYSLYLLGTYEKISAGDYSVGIIRYFYSNEAYEHTTTTKGDFCDFILYDKDGNTIVAMSKAIDDGETSSWYVDLGTYDPVTETGYPEFIYLVKFTDNALKTATVTRYDFMQGVDANENCANFCLTDGEIADIATLRIDGEFRTVESYTYDEATKAYTVTLSGGTKYLLELSYDKNGQPERLPDGSWDITITPVTESTGA